TLVGQPAPNRGVGAAVVIGISKTDHFSVGQLHAARALNLQKERLDGVVDPDDRRWLTFGLGGDFSTGAVRDHTPAIERAANALAGQLWIHAAQIDGEQIGRWLIQRPLIGAILLACAAHQGLVIPSDRVPGGLALFVEQAPRLHMLPDEGAYLRSCLR